MEECERLRRAIDAAPERYQAVLQFLLENDPEPEEIAQFLGKEPGAARKFVARALVHLRKALGGGGATGS